MNKFFSMCTLSAALFACNGSSLTERGTNSNQLNSKNSNSKTGEPLSLKRGGTTVFEECRPQAYADRQKCYQSISEDLPKSDQDAKIADCFWALSEALQKCEGNPTTTAATCERLSNGTRTKEKGFKENCETVNETPAGRPGRTSPEPHIIPDLHEWCRTAWTAWKHQYATWEVKCKISQMPVHPQQNGESSPANDGGNMEY